MMQVHINELHADCVELLPIGWKGWGVPSFSTEQMGFVVGECVRLGWFADRSEALSVWELHSDGQWITPRWVWEVVGE